MVAGGQGSILRVTVATAALTLALDWWLVRSHCALGAALANGIGQGVTVLGLLVVAERGFGFHTPWSFLRRLSLLAAGVGAGLWALATVVPDLVAVMVGPPLCALACVGFLRCSQLLNSEDKRRFGLIVDSLPGPLRAPLGKVLSWLGA
jgi:O-antigen/teichoic acid export membrane protein